MDVNFWISFPEPAPGRHKKSEQNEASPALAHLSRRHSVERVLEGMKANSSRWLKTKGGSLRLFQWQAGYGAFSVSPSQVETVRCYITRQAEHYRRMTFEQEFEEWLRPHGIPFDPGALWQIEAD